MDLLADRLAEIVGLGRREARQLLGDLHVLLLVDADPVGRAGNRLQARVGEGHLLLPVLALRVPGDVGHRARPVEGDERDQILELRRLDLAERLAHAGRLELEDAARVSPGEHRVGLRVVERKLRQVAGVGAVDQLERGVDDVEVPEPEEVHLEQAERLDVLHRELRDDLRADALLLQRHHVDERPVGDDDAGSVDRVLAHQALERLRQVDDLADDLVGVVRLPELGAGLQVVVQEDLRPFGDQLRDLVHGAVGDVEDAPGVAHGGAGRHRPERDDLRHAVAAVLLGDVVDHPVAAVDGEVDVDVRHRLAARVEEALEEEVVAERVDVRDLEAVRDKGARGRPAARPHPDAVPAREAHEVGDDQEVIRKAHLADRPQLELEALAQLGRLLPVPPRKALLALLDEELEGVSPVRGGERRQQDAVELDRHRAAVGDLERPRERLRVSGEERVHLVGRLEVELVGLEPPVAGVREGVPRLDAEEGLVRRRVLVAEVVDVAGGDERDPRPLRERDEPGIDVLLDRQARILELDEDLVAPEHVHEPGELSLGLGVGAALERLAHPPRETARQRDQALRVTGQELPVDPRLVVVALEVAGRGEPDQVLVALVRLGEQREVRIALRQRLPVVTDVDLAADHRLDPGLAAVPVELDRAGERAVVGQRHRRHVELGRPCDEIRDPARPVEDRVLGVDVQVHERGCHHERRL